MTENPVPFEPCPAYPELLALAAAMRPDWNRTELRDAMTAAHLAAWAWKDVFREVARLVLAEDETPATLRNSARRPVAQKDPGAYERGGALWRAANAEMQARVTGPQVRLTEDDDPRHRAGA